VPITLGVVGIASRNFTGDVARGISDKVDTDFGRIAPNKIREGKKRPKFARFLTTFDFNHSVRMSY